MTPHPPILIDGRRKVVIRGLRIVGGYNNIHLHRIGSVLIEDCLLVQPTGAIGKHILCDQCQNVVIRRVRCECTIGKGDGINTHDCRKVLIEDCTVDGPKRRDDVDTAVPLVIDGESSGPVTVRRFRASGAPAPTITIASGSGHVMTQIDGPPGCLIQIGSEGYDARPGLVTTDASPDRVESGIDGWWAQVRYLGREPKPKQAPVPKRPAGWSLKRFLAWLARRK